jgi:hypothetical protein
VELSDRLSKDVIIHMHHDLRNRKGPDVEFSAFLILERNEISADLHASVTTPEIILSYLLPIGYVDG